MMATTIWQQKKKAAGHGLFSANTFTKFFLNFSCSLDYFSGKQRDSFPSNYLTYGCLCNCTPIFQRAWTNTRVNTRVPAFPSSSPQQISPVGPHDWVNAQLHTFLQTRVPHLSLSFFCPSFCAAPIHLFFYHQKRCLLFSSATLSASHLSVSCTAVHMCISFHGQYSQWNHHNNRQPNFSYPLPP